jgi:hypothetical protein
VKDGVVTLTGFVPSFWEKDAAEKAAKRVYGVKGVANDIEVKLFWQRTVPKCVGRLYFFKRVDPLSDTRAGFFDPG